MRLSTQRDRDEESGLAVLRAALDAGVRFLDSADSYCLDAADRGHNERLISRAIAAWGGDKNGLVVATKGGIVRPEGRWVADGRARHLRAACEASRRALGVERIQLYQLHLPDPRTPLATSVRALDALRRDGLIERIGLSNVTVGQIEEARGVTEIAAVQVELSVWHDDNLRSGVVGYCIANGIRLVAYRPLGGRAGCARLLADPLLTRLAARHGGTAAEIALAWLLDLSPLVLPIPGVTRPESVASLARACRLALDDEDRALLDERFGTARRLRGSSATRRPDTPSDGEVVLVMGIPGSGKSTLAQQLVGRGYQRLNRDEAGGGLKDLLPRLGEIIAGGSRRVVLDNTYGSRQSRAAVLEKAWAGGLDARCLWLDTAIEDAQFNAAWRMVARYGRLLEPDEMRQASRSDPGVFPPTVQFRHRRELEPPDPSEGFARIDVVPFERRHDPSFTNRALFFWCEGVLRRSRSGGRTPASPEDVEVLAGRREALARHRQAGWRLIALSWQPEIADGTATRAQVEACFDRTLELLGLSMEVLYCPHGGGPPACWCRKPLPGLGIVSIQRYTLDPSQCTYVGASGHDRAFARGLGFRYADAAEFF